MGSHTKWRSRQERPQTLTWSFQVTEEQPSSKVLSHSFTCPQHSASNSSKSEVEVLRTDPSLPEEQLVATMDGSINIDFPFYNFATPLDISTLDITTTRESNTIQHINMASKPKPHRVKYTELPPGAPTSLTVATPPTSQALPSPPHLMQHPILPATASTASPPPTADSEVKINPKRRVKYTEFPPGAPSSLATSSALNSKQHPTSTASPSLGATKSSKAVVLYSSSLSTLDGKVHHEDRLATLDKMVRRTESNQRKKQPPTAVQAALFLRERRAADKVNGTKTFWRYNLNGDIVNAATGAPYKPDFVSKIYNQTTANPPLRSTDPFVGAKQDSSESSKAPSGQAIVKHYKPRVTNGWDPELPVLGSEPHANATPRTFNNKGHGHIEPKFKKPREGPWIKNSQIPKGDPKRHQTRWSSPSREDSGLVWATWDTAQADWQGGLGPATLDWDSRSAFRDHQSTANIEVWLHRSHTALERVDPIKFTNGGNTFSFVISPSGSRELVEEEKGEVAPRYWTVEDYDGKSPKTYWLDHISRGVEPVDEDDLKNVKPWFRLYKNKTLSLLSALVQPEVAGVDSDENELERLARENDNGSATVAENRKAAEKAKRFAQRKRTLAKRERAHKLSGQHNSNQALVVSNSIKPGVKMFIRHARKEDVIELRDIYNHSIDNSFVVPETERLIETDMLERWQAIRGAKLPFIVACKRGDRVKARGKDDLITPDRIVGFACAADWSDGVSIYRPTVKLEVFVHMEFTLKNVGNCLVDYMMGLLDPRFIERGGYDTVNWSTDVGEAARAVSNILIQYSYQAEDTARMLWVASWLKRRFGFEKAGDLQRIGEKFNKQ
jgi:L-amino acid N-acyltransferase YncA